MAGLGPDLQDCFDYLGAIKKFDDPAIPVTFPRWQPISCCRCVMSTRPNYLKVTLKVGDNGSDPSKAFDLCVTVL